MEIGAPVVGRAARPRQVKHRRYELADWEFKPDNRGYARSERYFEDYPTSEVPKRGVSQAGINWFWTRALVPRAGLMAAGVAADLDRAACRRP
jgi:hypothetical protein